MFLILGLAAKYAKIGGIALLLLYYLSHPPMALLEYGAPTEGSYLIINKTLIEMIALAVLLVFPTQFNVGIDRIIAKLK